MINSYKVGRELTYILRHKPEKINLAMDKHGWVKVPELLDKFRYKGCSIKMSDLEHVVEVNDKKRYEFNEDKTKVRATQGHSRSIDLNLKHSLPPFNLYHGTLVDYMAVIDVDGLKKMGRDHVHLSEDLCTARKVASRRKGKIVILVIDTGAMRSDGIKFYKTSNNVWLTDYVDPKYIH